MGAEMCLSARRDECHDNIDVKQVFGDSSCYRKINRKRLQKKAKKYRNKIQNIESMLRYDE